LAHEQFPDGTIILFYDDVDPAKVLVLEHAYGPDLRARMVARRARGEPGWVCYCNWDEGVI
jgi:hypothetical protein